MLLIRFTASCFLYLLVVLCFLTLVAVGILAIIAPTAISSKYDDSANAYRIAGAVICFLFAILLVVVACCLRRQISLASSIIKVASRFVTEHCMIVLLPLVLFFVTLAFTTLWVFQAFGFYSLGTATTTKHQYPFQHFTVPTYVKVLFGFHVFYLIWGVMFFVETDNFIVGGAATSWFFRRDSPYS